MSIGMPLQRLSTQSFRDVLPRYNDPTPLNPQYAFYQQNPEVVFEDYLRMLDGSNSQLASLRSAYNSLFNRYLGQYASGYPETSYLTFADYLASIDPNYELARLSPAARGEYSQRFSSPARWIAF